MTKKNDQAIKEKFGAFSISINNVEELRLSIENTLKKIGFEVNYSEVKEVQYLDQPSHERDNWKDFVNTYSHKPLSFSQENEVRLVFKIDTGLYLRSNFIDIKIDNLNNILSHC